MRDTIFYRRLDNNERLERYDNADTLYSDNNDFHYNYDSRNIIIVNNTGVQTVVFLPEELYPNET